jgi:SOUL heme-binding protein
MKITIISFVICIIVLILAQVYSIMSTTRTEQHKYQVLKSYGNVEIRKYEPAIFSSVMLGKNSYREISGKGFGILAGYIFGGNEKKENISMTSPVTMELGDSTKMKFMVPKGYTMNSLPEPNDKRIIFEEQNEKIIAAIQFDGWADNDKIEYYTEQLKSSLAKEHISHTNKFSFLGYNPPYEVINRRNEIIVELIDFK